MGDNQTQQSTSSTGTSDPVVKSTLDQLLGPSAGGIQGVLNKGPQVFGQSLYAGAGPTTTNAQSAALAAAGNPDYKSGVTGALSNQAGVAAGNSIGINDPAYQAMRSQLGSDVMGQVGSQFTNSGRFGGGSYVKAATNDLTSALGGLDYNQYLNGQQQQQQAISNLPGLYSALQAPSATAGAIGSAQDANSQGALTGQADLYNRTNNANLSLLQQLAPLLSGSAPVAGSTTTNTQPATPWWQAALGTGVALL